MNFPLWFLWAVAAAFFMIAEIMTPGFFMFWVGVGCAAAAILALMHIGIFWQLIAFIAVSATLFLLSRRFAKGKHFAPVGPDRLVGQEGVTIEDIDRAKNLGRVRIDREEWRADSEGGETIANGVRVKVVKVDGTHLIVKKV